MKATLIFLFNLLTVFSFANDTTYYSVIRKAIIKMESEYKYENFMEMANTCERIIPVKPEEWIPLYYMAYAYANMGHLSSDENLKEKYFENAQKSLDAAFKIAPEESELCVMQAFLYYCLMETNSMVTGPIYNPKAKKMLEKAEALNDKNPRIYFLKGQSLLYTPEFMGGGKDAAKPVIDKAIQLYEEFKPVSDVYPNWGKGATVDLQQKLNN